MQLEEFQAKKKAQRATGPLQQKPPPIEIASGPPSSPIVQTQASPAGSSTSRVISPAARAGTPVAQVAGSSPAAEANGSSVPPVAVRLPAASVTKAPAASSPAGYVIAGDPTRLQNGLATDQQEGQHHTAVSNASALSGQQASSESSGSHADDVPRLKKLIQQLKLRIAKHDKEYASLKEQLDSRAADQADSASHQERDAALATAQQQIVSLESQLSTQQHDCNELQDQLSAANSKGEEATSRLASMQTQKADLEAELQEARASMAKLSEAAAGKSSASEKLEHQLQEAQEALRVSKASADAKQAEADTLQAEVQRLTLSAEEAQAATANVQSRLDEAEAMHGETVADLRQQLSDLQGQQEGASSSAAELASLQQEFTTLEEQVCHDVTKGQPCRGSHI